MPYEACKLLIINNTDYWALNDKWDYDSVAAVAHASAVTDVNGKATAKVTAYNSLYAVCYASDNTFLGKFYFNEYGKEPLYISLER